MAEICTRSDKTQILKYMGMQYGQYNTSVHSSICIYNAGNNPSTHSRFCVWRLGQLCQCCDQVMGCTTKELCFTSQQQQGIFLFLKMSTMVLELTQTLENRHQASGKVKNVRGYTSTPSYASVTRTGTNFKVTVHKLCKHIWH